MTAYGVLIRRFARDRILLREVLRRLDHSGDHTETIHRLRAFAPAIQSIVKLHRAGARTPAHVGRVVLDVAHALDAARDHDVGRTGLDHHGSGDDGLQSAAAAAIQLHTRHLDRQARLQRRPAAHARCFAVDVRLREHDIIDARGIHRGALQHFLDHRRTQMLDCDGLQASAERTDGSADRGDDGCSSHDNVSPDNLKCATCANDALEESA